VGKGPHNFVDSKSFGENLKRKLLWLARPLFVATFRFEYKTFYAFIVEGHLSDG
jgi:hypothetical protein